MKTFSGFIIIAIALAAQLPYLTAAPYRDALMKMLATMAELQEEKTTNADLQQTYYRPSYGISTIRCPQDFLQLNPNLEDLQAYWRDFGIEVDCSSSSVYCTDLQVHLDRKTYHSVVCYSPSQGMRLYTCTCNILIHDRNIIRL